MSPTPLKSIKNDKLQKAAKAVTYEINMFRLTTNALFYYSNNFNTEDKTKNQFLLNVLLESFGIHSYNLYKFFYQGKREKKNNRFIVRKSSDLIAEDFNINKKYFRNTRSPKRNLKIIENKRNKQIAHLTYNRIYRDKRTKPWHFGIISKYMEQTINAFIDSLPVKYTKFF
jgi:hypothetical protein